MRFNPLAFGDDPVQRFFGLAFGAVILLAALASFGNSSQSYTTSDMGSNWIALPGFFADFQPYQHIDGEYNIYPSTKGAYSDCILMTNHPDYIDYFPDFYVINEIVGDAVNVAPGYNIFLSGYLYANESTTADDYVFRGARLLIDMYGAEGRICEIALPNGGRLYGADNNEVQAFSCALRGSNTWKYVEFDFTVASTYLADPWGAYETNEAVVPTHFYVIVVSGCGITYRETEFGCIWVRDLELYVYA